MSLITKPSTHSAGDTILAAETNSNLDTIYDDYNGNITNANIKATAAIADSKLAQITTAGKIAGSAMGNAYPVGSIYFNASVATNPGTLLGFGTWTAFGAGKVLVGLDSGDTDFDTVEETGGVKEVTLTGGQSGTSAHTHSIATANDETQGSSVAGGTATNGSATSGASSEADADDAHTNLQPYITVYMWKRTA